ncbi:MAG: tungsten formylmethanofuran dehydrogenase [Bacteroidetes bacterium]|nr:tungsten formylmethanofuran dehydrogenase [Bacteroidota bacterium]
MQDLSLLRRAFTLMCQVRAMASTYEANRSICTYVHSTSRGHEAIQLAAAFQLQAQDFVSPYYRDESMLLGLGFSPYELMLQLLAKAEDPFSGGREYYSHPSYYGKGKPVIIHQSSATGMQAIPTTGIAHGIHYWEKWKRIQIERGIDTNKTLPPFMQANPAPIVICSLGDASVTEGEVSEAMQVAVLNKLPIIFLVQDNNWGISVTASEARAMNAFEFAAGFKGLNRIQVDGSDFEASYSVLEEVVGQVRKNRQPYLIHAQVPLLGHHTSGVRKEFYRSDEDWQKHLAHDPFLKLRKKLAALSGSEQELQAMEQEAIAFIEKEFERAKAAPEPDPATVSDHVYAPTPVVEERGKREVGKGQKIPMVDAALFAIREIMEEHPEAILYGQDVGNRLGGVFRETATLAEQFGDHRVFNTAIQEAYIVGSTAGMAAAGLRPIVEVQFGDYLYPGFNQLVMELSKSCYLTMGKFPIPMILRVPTGAYGGGGPYHSSSVESTLLTVKGIKIVYPSNAADMKGLMKAAFLDPNPVVMLEHKGLYWSKVPDTEFAKTTEPDADYCIPLGKALVVLESGMVQQKLGSTLVIITYGMGVHWALAAAKQFPGQIEIVDLRTLFPLDEELIYTRVKQHGKALVLTEEQQLNSFAEALAGRIATHCFQSLDAPVQVMGALDLPAIPMNSKLEQAMLPNPKKVAERLNQMLNS